MTEGSTGRSTISRSKERNSRTEQNISVTTEATRLGGLRLEMREKWKCYFRFG